MFFKSKISGVPCFVQTTWKIGERYPSIAVYDRRGYAANWLEKKISESEFFDIVEQAENELDTKPTGIQYR